MSAAPGTWEDDAGPKASGDCVYPTGSFPANPAPGVTSDAAQTRRLEQIVYLEQLRCARDRWEATETVPDLDAIAESVFRQRELTGAQTAADATQSKALLDYFKDRDESQDDAPADAVRVTNPTALQADVVKAVDSSTQATSAAQVATTDGLDGVRLAIFSCLGATAGLFFFSVYSRAIGA